MVKITYFFRRKMCVFYNDEGGYRSTYRDNSQAEEIYFLGIIDILTPYSTSKRIEHAVKSIIHDKVSFLLNRMIIKINRLPYRRLTLFLTTKDLSIS